MQRKMSFVFFFIFLTVLMSPLMASASNFADTITSYMQGGSYCWFCPILLRFLRELTPLQPISRCNWRGFFGLVGGGIVVLDCVLCRTFFAANATD